MAGYGKIRNCYPHDDFLKSRHLICNGSKHFLGHDEKRWLQSTGKNAVVDTICYEKCPPLYFSRSTSARLHFSCWSTSTRLHFSWSTSTRLHFSTWLTVDACRCCRRCQRTFYCIFHHAHFLWVQTSNHRQHLIK